MNTELFYDECGRGEPLILLHGNGEDHTYFMSQINFFAPYYRVITPDTRGHGRSRRGDGVFSLTRFADDLHDLMHILNISKAHILGFSDGANIAMLFALKYPDKVDRLILNGGNITPDGVKFSVQFPIEIGYRIAKYFSGHSQKAKKNAEILGLMVCEPHIELDELAKITAKTLVIAGTDDMIKRSHTELIARSLPNGVLKFIKGDHFIAAKHPDEFNNAVMDFLKE